MRVEKWDSEIGEEKENRIGKEEGERKTKYYLLLREWITFHKFRDLLFIKSKYRELIE